jgi:high affinity Mn2+ porin
MRRAALFYATGGFAWTYNQQSLTQLSTGNSVSPFLWRLGWTAGAGVEVPIVSHWTARLEYLFTDYGTNNKTFFGTQPFNSDFQLQELRLGLNYQFGNDAVPFGAPIVTKGGAAPAPDILSLHGQSTFVYQGYPAFRSPYEGAQSLPGVGEARDTFDISLFLGLRLWKGAEFWINPEIDQGHGLADTHGVAGFTSGESASRVVICYLVTVMPAKEWRLAAGRSMSKVEGKSIAPDATFEKVPR